MLMTRMKNRQSPKRICGQNYQQMNMQNVRVKLPNQAEDEASEMSIEDPEAEKNEERIERMKITFR